MRRDLFKIKNVRDGQFVQVEPHWQFKGVTGDVINIKHQVTISNLYLLNRLKSILTDREVELKNPISIEQGSLNCFIFLDGVNIKNYFPELQPH